MHKTKIITAGAPLTAGSKVMVLLHGRGGSAEDILSLASYLEVGGYTLMAPEATNNSWYPNSFLAAPTQNEPWLSSALDILEQLVKDLNEQSIASEYIFFTGFSQGACLSLEFTARHAQRYGGIIAFTGGLIGDRIYRDRYKGDFNGTPVFIGSSNPDPHVPVERVYASSNIFRDMNASVTEKVYTNMGHTINQDEIAIANRVVLNAAAEVPNM